MSEKVILALCVVCKHSQALATQAKLDNMMSTVAQSESDSTRTKKGLRVQSHLQANMLTH